MWHATFSLVQLPRLIEAPPSLVPKAEAVYTVVIYCSVFVDDLKFNS